MTNFVESKIEVGGPYDPDNPGDQDSSVSKRDTSTPNVNLYGVQESRADNSADLNSAHVPGTDSDESILGGFLGREEFNFDGQATGNRLSGGDQAGVNTGKNGLPGHPFAAVRQYALRLESLVLYNQGWGYKLIDEQRDRTLDPGGDNRDGFLVKEVSWERTGGGEFMLDFNVEGSRAKGTSVGTDNIKQRQNYINEVIDGSNNVGPGWIDGPNGITGSIPTYVPYGHDKTEDQIFGWSLSDPETPDLAYTLGSVETLRVERSVDVNIKEIALGNPGDNIGLPTSAPKTKIFIEGVITPKDTMKRTSISNYTDARERLDNIARYIPNNWVGTNKDILIREGFTDRQFRGQFKTYSTTWESGDDLRLNYTVELVEGQGIGN